MRAGATSGTLLDRAAFVLLLLGVVAFPFPYGGITPLGTCLIEMIAFLLLALTILGSGMRSGQAPPARRRDAASPAGETPPVLQATWFRSLRGAGVVLAAIAGIALLGVVQILPLSAPVVARLSPASVQVYDDAARALAVFERPAPVPRISIAPSETVGTILLTLAYLAVFTSSALLLRTRRRRRVFAGVLLSSAGIHVIASTVMRAFVPGNEDRLHGAFINPNHFAGYLTIMLCVAFGVLWREVLYARDDTPHARERSARFELRFLRLSTRALLWGLFAAALGLTKSRGGILAAFVIICLMITAGLLHPLLRKERWAYSVLGGGTVAAALGFVILAVRQQPILRFLASDPRDPGSDLRITLWRLTIDAWQQFPIFGSGLGTFRESFRRVQPRDLPYLVEFAHSDSLQLLATAGIVGVALAIVAFAVLAVRLVRSWWTEQRREETAFALAGLGALFAAGLHGLVEFNLSIPAIPATLAAVLGLSWAATHSEF